MIIHFPLLLFGLLLLWFPRQWMRLGTGMVRRRRKVSAAAAGLLESREKPDAGNPRVTPRREFAKVRNYFDLLRGAAGSLAIMGGAQISPSIVLREGETSQTEWLVFGIKAGILVAGLVVQVMRFERQRFHFFAPIFYLSGLSLSLCSIWGGLFAFVLIWGIIPLVGNAQMFLTFYGVLMGSFGYFLQENDWRLPVLAFLLCFLPVLLSMLAGRPLVVYSRKAAPPLTGSA